MKYKRIILLLFIIFGPFSLFFLLSRSAHSFKTLDYFSDGVPPVYKNFSFPSLDGEVLTDEKLKDKILIVTYMRPGCPYRDCNLDAQMMKFVTYDEVMKAQGFSDVVFITEVLDSTGQEAAHIRKALDLEKETFWTQYIKEKNLPGKDHLIKMLDNKRWYFIPIKDQSFFNVAIKPTGLNPFTSPDSTRPGHFMFERSMLLIDKEKRIRGFYETDQSSQFKNILEDLRVLKKEYAKKNKK